jgi:hypothetical protein
MSQHQHAGNPVDLLIPFTGYYPIEGRPGAFVLVDTNMLYTLGATGKPGMVNLATVSLCMDGKTVDEYAFPEFCTFDGRHLTVKHGGRTVAHLRLFKDFLNGNSSGFIGTIDGELVGGTTPFSPIMLPLFAAKYYTQTTHEPQYQVQLDIRSDYSVYYRDDNGLSQVKSYLFNYAMFVIQFEATVNKTPTKFTFEMGTTAMNGLVAGNFAVGGLLVSNYRANVYPPPGKA